MISQEKWFYFANGKSAKDIPELIKILEAMSVDEFSFHVNSGKNDFANWIEGVFNEKGLASDLRSVANKEEMVQALKEFLEEQEAPEEKETEKEEAKVPQDKSEEKPEEKEEHTQESLFKFSEHAPVMEQPAPELKDELKVEAEHDLVNDDIKDIVEDARQEFEIEGRQLETKKQFHLFPKEDKFSFVVKEFIYGFILGLIFGLIMLGALMNVKV